MFSFEPPDVVIVDMPCGDFMFKPMTDVALRWIKSYLFGTPQSCGGERGVLIVEAPYASDVMRKMQRDGLHVRWRSN